MLFTFYQPLSHMMTHSNQRFVALTTRTDLRCNVPPDLSVGTDRCKGFQQICSLWIAQMGLRTVQQVKSTISVFVLNARTLHARYYRGLGFRHDHRQRI